MSPQYRLLRATGVVSHVLGAAIWVAGSLLYAQAGLRPNTFLLAAISVPFVMFGSFLRRVGLKW